MGCPLTNGSCGRDTSFGVKSVDDALREPTLRAAASAFALGLIEEALGGAAVVGEGMPDPAPEPLRSEAVDSVLGPIGTVRFCRLWVLEDSA